MYESSLKEALVCRTTREDCVAIDKCVCAPHVEEKPTVVLSVIESAVDLPVVGVEQKGTGNKGDHLREAKLEPNIVDLGSIAPEKEKNSKASDKDGFQQRLRNQLQEDVDQSSNQR